MRLWIKDPLALFGAGAERGLVVEGTRIVELVGRGRMPVLPVENVLGLLEIEWAILGGQSGGSMQERTLRRRYSSSFSP